MVDPEKIKQLVEMMAEYELSELVLRDGEEEIRLSRPGSCPGPSQVIEHAAPPPHVTVMPAPAQAAVPASAPAPSEAPTPPEEHGLEPITSPMVGTFYASPDPDSPPFVSEGSVVNENTVVCIVEAMKVFNEINAGINGVIEKVLLNNEVPVEYGQPLFLVRPS